MSDTDLDDALEDEDEGSYEPNHYEILRLDETATTRDIAKAFLAGDWGWYDDERAVEAVARRREEAYRVLGDPVQRAAYDMQQGYTKGHLARRIGREHNWGLAWGMLFLLLTLFLLIDHENVSRMLGSNFAPDFAERRVYVEEEICEDRFNRVIECAPGYFKGEFHSSDGRWEWVLNSWLALSLGPALVTGMVALGGYHLLDRMAGMMIAWVRHEGHADTWVRAALWLFTLLVPVAIIIQLARYGLGVSTPFS